SEPLSSVLYGAVNGLAGVMDRDRDTILARAKLSLEVPELRARFWEELEKARDLVVGIMAARSGREAADFELRVLAMVFLTATFEAVLEWLKQDGRGDMMKLVIRALDLAQVGPRLDELGSAARKTHKPPLPPPPL